MKKQLPLLLLAALISITVSGCGAEVPSDSTSESMPVIQEESSQPHSEELQPLYGNQIADGTYSIEVTSSSSMFRIVDAQLTVADGVMSAVLTLSGKGYEKLYMGTGEEALADEDDRCVYYVENDEGMYIYQVPVDALNQEINLAAWSIKKETWYDRIVVFQSALIPEDAITM